ncbi:MAG: tetratricopeptide repeat protein, partial [Deltaproteobacteria bacterium]|nr:tetratricopeptide repeat protein [Deltaproteobacteria bacterium]
MKKGTTPLQLAFASLLLVAAAGSRQAAAQEPAPSTGPEQGASGEERSEARFDPEVVRRYRTILEQNPEMGTIFRKLVELYGRKAAIGELAAEYAQLAREKPDSYAYRMIHGHLLRTLGSDEAALAQYMEAARLKPTASLPWSSAASLAEALQDLTRARSLYEETLPRLSSIDEKEKVLERLAEMAFRSRDLPEAKRRLEAMQRLEPGELHLAGEVARIYERNGHLEEALEQWRSILAQEKGNTPETVRVLKEVSLLQSKLGQDREAEASLRRAMGLVRPGNWNLPEIRARLVEIYRRRDQLRTLIDEFEQSWTGKDYPELIMLAALHDEVGQEEEAMAGYRKAVQRRPREAEPRLKLIAIHERKGELDLVVAEYKKLIAALPGEFRYALELADIYHRRGDTGLALKMLDGLARSGERDPTVLAALAERYLRHGLKDKALATTRRLVALEPGNETHLVNLGEQLFQLGKTDKALETWQRILEVVPEKARAWSIYGETLAGHDLLEEAVAALSKAVQLSPDKLRFRKTLAGILRRAEKPAQARQVWLDILAHSTSDRQRAEARENVVA